MVPVVIPLHPKTAMKKLKENDVSFADFGINTCPLLFEFQPAGFAECVSVVPFLGIRAPVLKVRNLG